MSANADIVLGKGGGCKILTHADKGGRGVSKKLTFADKGGGGSKKANISLTSYYVNGP